MPWLLTTPKLAACGALLLDAIAPSRKVLVVQGPLLDSKLVAILALAVVVLIELVLVDGLGKLGRERQRVVRRTQEFQKGPRIGRVLGVRLPPIAPRQRRELASLVHDVVPRQGFVPVDHQGAFVQCVQAGVVDRAGVDEPILCGRAGASADCVAGLLTPTAVLPTGKLLNRRLSNRKLLNKRLLGGNLLSLGNSVVTITVPMGDS